jgi:alpha-beta hydrolase superfamily lysophospholipase
VIVVHGLAEHSGRYEHVGAHLAAAGCAVHAYDQQGHGKSGGVRCHARRFAHLLDDLEDFVATVRADQPALPIYLVGHSLGGLVVASYASQRDPDVAGVVTSGAALALPEDLSRGRVFLARGLRWFAPRLSMSAGLDPEALSRDPEVIRAYLEDPMVDRRVTTSLAAEIVTAVERVASAGARIRVPMLLLHGEEDRLCPIAGSRRLYEQLTVTPRNLRTYPGLRHEIFNEPEHVAVLNDLIEWMGGIESNGAGSNGAGSNGAGSNGAGSNGAGSNGADRELQ